MWLNIVGGILALLSTIAQGFGSLVNWLRESSLKKQGKLEAENQSLQKNNQALGKSVEAREQARIAAASVPDSASLPDDGFRRD